MGGVSPTVGGVSSTEVQLFQDARSADVESADYGEEDIETQRLLDEAVYQLCVEARAAASYASKHLQAPDTNFEATVENAMHSNCADAVLALVAGSDLKIVMCLTTYCRTEQLKAALPINLACSWGLRDKVIWVLADMNDEDESSTLMAWLAETVAASLVPGLLYVVRRAEPWSGWHACFAKNTSHMAGIHIASTLLESRPPNVILVNCDSDNLPSKKFFTYLLGRHALMCDAQGLEWPKLPGVSFRHPGATSTTGRICLSALVFLRLGGYDQAMLPMGYQDIDLTRRLAKLGETLNINGAEETGNVLNNVMAAVTKSQRRKEEVKAKVANVALERRKMKWEAMNESNMQRSKVALKKGVVERSQGSSVGLKFDVVEFKDLLGGVSPSQWVWLTPPEASGSASSSSAAAPTAAASTAAARTAVQAQKPKFKPAPPPSPRGPPGLSREPLQVRFSRSACRDLPRSTRRRRLRSGSGRRSLLLQKHQFQVAMQLCQALSGSARIPVVFLHFVLLFMS